MTDRTKNQTVPSPDPGTALPNIVRVTAIALLAYGVVMFSVGVYLPIWIYINSRGLEILIGLPVGILIGLVMILISFGLLKGGYAMLHREVYGTGVGIAATMWGFFPVVLFINAMVSANDKHWTGGVGTMLLDIFLFFLLLNVIFLYALSKADKILKGVG